MSSASGQTMADGHPGAEPGRYSAWLHELANGLQALPDKPEETPDATLRALWHLASGAALSAQAAGEVPLPRLDAAGETRLTALIARRASGEPLAHLTGRQRFLGLEMLAGPEALIPRRETELLGRAAIDALNRSEASTPVVVDVCTGSGNLALAAAHYVARAQVFAADLSPDAVALARRNAEHLGLAGRVSLRAGDLLDPFDQPAFHGKVDLLMCNPPYISSRKVDAMPEEIIGYEPRLAFDGGPLGVAILQRLVREAPRFLRPGGILAFEVGLGQGQAVRKRLESGKAFTRIDALSDEGGQIRAILARV